MIYEFDRYVSGRLMAEGVTIERATSLDEAIIAAARIAARGPNGETPVLILREQHKPSAWRWKFDTEGAWHYGDTRPGPFRFGDPDVIEPLYLSALSTSGAYPSSPEKQKGNN